MLPSFLDWQASMSISHDAGTASQVIAGSPPTKAADIYSFGVVLWELLSLETPTSRKLRPIRSAAQLSRPMCMAKCSSEGFLVDSHCTLLGPSIHPMRLRRCPFKAC